MLSGLAAQPDWSVDPTLFEHNGSITAAVWLLNVQLGSPDDILGVFVNDECRGLVNGVETPGGEFLFPLTVFSDNPGDDLSFMFYHAGVDAIYGLEEEVIFEIDLLLGNPQTPFDLNIANVDCNGVPEGSAYLDICGECVGGTTGLDAEWAVDCAGICFGTAFFDDCEICSAGNTGHEANSDMDCTGVCFGTAVCAPELSVTPDIINFGPVIVNEVSQQTVSVANLGVADGFDLGMGDLILQDVVLTGLHVMDYTIIWEEGTIVPGEDQIITVTFIPAQTGLRTAELTIITSVGDVQVSLTAEGIDPGINGIPAEIEFAPVQVGLFSEATVQVSNTGTTDLIITDITSSVSAVFNGFVPQDPVIVPGSDLLVQLLFTPQNMGQAEGTIFIQSNAGPFPVAAIGLGLAPQSILDPNEIHFEDVLINTAEYRDLTLSNDGNMQLAIYDIVLTGASAHLFHVSGSPGVLQPGESHTFMISFQPTQIGPYSIQLNMTTNAGQFSVSIHGYGVTNPPTQVLYLPDLVLDEDAAPISIADLDEVFADDYGPLSYIVTYEPSGIITTALSEDHLFSIIPAADANGEVIITVSVSDSEHSIQDQFIATLNPIPDPPVALDVNLTTSLGTALEFALEAADPDDDALFFSLVGSAQHGSISGIIPNLIYTPDPGFFGEDTIIFSVTDGLFYDQGTLAIIVNPAELEVTFRLDARRLQRLGLLRPDLNMKIALQVVDGFFPLTAYLTDQDEDSIWTTTIIQGAPDQIHYAFGIDPDGIDVAHTSDWIFELDGPNAGRELITEPGEDALIMSVVPFDDLAQGPVDLNFAAEVTRSSTVQALGELIFDFQDQYTFTSLLFNQLDRNALISVRRYDGNPGGDAPDGIAVVGSNGYWSVAYAPAGLNFDADFSVQLSPISGISAPGDLRWLQRESGDSPWEVANTSHNPYENELTAENITQFSQWILGSISTENPLIPELPGFVADPAPIDMDVNVEPTLTLSWQPADRTLWYDIYLWTVDTDPPQEPLADWLTGIQYDPPSNLTYGITYNWQIVARNIYGETAGPIWSFTVRHLPDLVVANIDLPSSAWSGQDLTVTWEVRNDGQAPTNSPQWYDRLYLSPDTLLSANTDLLLGHFPNVSFLNPGESYANTRSFELPDIIFGDHVLILTTGVSSGMPEVNHNNNTAISESVFIELSPFPDLQVTQINATNVTFSGTEINLGWTVTNTDVAPTPTNFWYDAVYLSADTVLSGNDFRLGNVSHTGYLLPDESYSVNTSYSIPHPIWGDYYILIQTDDGDTVEEFVNDVNNISAPEQLTVILLPPPNLAVNNIQHSTVFSAHQTIWLDWEVENIGPGSTFEGNWQDRAYLVSDDSGDLSGAHFLGEFTRSGNLSPGHDYHVEIEVTLPGDLIGNWYLAVKTDTRNDVFEHFYEDDNVTVSPIPIQIMSPDLAITGIDFGATAESGQLFEIEWEMENLGPGDLIERLWSNHIYLSPTAEVDLDNLLHLHTFELSTSLDAGDAMWGEVTFTLPQGLFGTFYPVFRIDPQSSLPDENTGNNLFISDTFVSVELSPWPDLQVVDIDVPDTAVAGETILVEWWVENEGESIVEPGLQWIDRIYLSDSPVWDSTWEVQLAVLQTQLDNFWNQSSYTSEVNLLLPAGLSEGEYYIYVVTDHGNDVYEHTDENNNVLGSEGFLVEEYPPVDLVATHWGGEWPSAAGSGSTETISWRVRNDAPGTTLQNRWDEDVYLSADDMLDDSDVNLKHLVHNGALLGNASYTREITIRFPDGIAGEYYLILAVDGPNQVSELDDDNLLIASVQVVFTPPPDLFISQDNTVENAIAGQPLELMWTVTNIGEGYLNVAEQYVAIYLSANTVVDGTDRLLASIGADPTLDAGESSEMGMGVEIPNYYSGNYYLILQADSRDDVYEHNGEDNNELAVPLSITMALPADLIVTDVSFPPDAVPGEVITVSWTLQNIGDNPASGRMRDGIYFSTDEDWQVDDPLLGFSQWIIDLDPLESMRITRQIDVSRRLEYDAYGDLDAELPGMTPGDFHCIVRTDLMNNIRESNWENNMLVSSATVNVDLPQLTPGIPQNIFMNSGDEFYYKIDLPAGEDAQVVLGTVDQPGYTAVYIRREAIPAPNYYDYAANVPFSVTQQTIMPGTVGGTYYILIKNEFLTNELTPNLLMVNILQFSVQDVYPDHGGNAGSVTLRVNGAQFTDDCTLSLQNATGETLIANQTLVQNSTHLMSRLDLRGMSVGQYNVILTDAEQNSVLLPGGFTVEEEGMSEPWVHLEGPSAVRPGWPIRVLVTVGNDGNVNLLDYFLVLSFPANTFILDEYPHYWPAEYETDDYEASAIVGDRRILPVWIMELPPQTQQTFAINIYPNGTGLIDYTATLVPAYDSDFTASGDPALIMDSWGYQFLLETAIDIYNGEQEDGLVRQFIDDDINDALGQNAQNAMGTVDPTWHIAGAVVGGILLGPPGVGIGLAIGSFISQVNTGIGIVQTWQTMINARNRQLALAMGQTTVVAPRDPNDIIGPPGYGDEHWVALEQTLPYTIRFENDPNLATAPAQVVMITQDLDIDIDPGSFRLGQFGFGNFIFEVPSNVAFYSDRLDLRDSLNLFLDVNIGLNVNTNQAFWIFESIEPETGLPPADPFAGFLAVNDTLLHNGEGFVSYSIQSNPLAETGDVIDAVASIIFDNNEPIETPPIFNTIDAVAPVSMVSPEVIMVDETTFTLSWNAVEDEGGSGLENVDLYQAVDQTGYYPLDWALTESSMTLTVETEHIYRFFTLARDNAGNLEAMKIAAELTVDLTTGGNSPPEIISEPVLVAWEDSEYTYPVIADDLDLPAGDQIRFDLLTAPTWLSIDTLSGVITGIPLQEDVGSHDVAVQAYDLFGGQDVQDYDLEVFHVNHAPIITADPPAITSADVLFEMELTGEDVDAAIFGDDLIFMAEILPSWMTLENSELTLTRTDPQGNSISKQKPDLTHQIQRSPVTVQSMDIQALQETFNQEIQDRNLSIHRELTISALLTGTPSQTNLGDTLVSVILLDNVGGADTLTFPFEVIYEVFGCTDEAAMNYNPAATDDDGSCIYSGDFNQDQLVNIIDIVLMIEMILYAQTPSDYQLMVSDFDNDGSINIVDVVWLVQMILNESAAFREPVSAVKILHAPDQISLVATGQVAAIQIDFRGDYQIMQPDLPSGWGWYHDNDRLIFISLDGSSLSEPKLAALEGDLQIISATVVDWQLNCLDNIQILEIPGEYILFPAYPNPFNPVTTLHFGLPADSKVQLNIYDLTGRLVSQLLNTRISAGYHQYEWEAQELASGVYFAVLSAEDAEGRCGVHRQKMMLLK